MIRLIALLAAATRLGRLRSAHGVPALLAARRQPSRGAAPPQPRQSRRSAHSASTRREWTARSAPGDDFYEFANGTWAKNTAIPADKSNYGMFIVLQDSSQQRVRDLLEAAKDDPNSKIGDRLLQLPRRGSGRSQGPCSDQAMAGRNSRARQPRRLCSTVGQGRAQRYRRPVRRRRRPGRPQQRRPISSGFNQAGLGMPDRDMYLLNEPNLVELRSAYLDHLTKMLTLGRRGQCRRARQGHPGFRNGDREGVLDPRGQQRRDQNLQQDDRCRSWRSSRRDSTGRPIFSERGVDINELLVAQPSAFTAIAALARRGAPVGA